MSFKDWMIENLDRDDIEQIYNHGCESGVPHLIYYSETNELYSEYESDIWDTLEEIASDFGHKNALELIASFNGANGVRGEAQFNNMLVWATAEHYAREIVDNNEFKDEEEDEEN